MLKVFPIVGCTRLTAESNPRSWWIKLSQRWHCSSGEVLRTRGSGAPGWSIVNFDSLSTTLCFLFFCFLFLNKFPFDLCSAVVQSQTSPEGAFGWRKTWDWDKKPGNCEFQRMRLVCHSGTGLGHSWWCTTLCIWCWFCFCLHLPTLADPSRSYYVLCSTVHIYRIATQVTATSVTPSPEVPTIWEICTRHCFPPRVHGSSISHLDPGGLLALSSTLSQVRPNQRRGVYRPGHTTRWEYDWFTHWRYTIVATVLRKKCLLRQLFCRVFVLNYDTRYRIWDSHRTYEPRE